MKNTFKPPRDNNEPSGSVLNTLDGRPTNVRQVGLEDIAAGRTLGKFRLIEPIGRGGMGEVWNAHDSVGNRTVVIKFVPPELRRFPAELARVKETFGHVQALQHQHICPLYQLDEDSKLGAYLVMKFIDGTTLSEYCNKYIQEHREFSVSEVVRLLKPVAAALDYAHTQKVVHRDIKPQNIMVSRDGCDVQVVDFGLATEIRTSISRVSRVTMDSSGTYPYMAPEQWRGQYQDSKTDQYALGVVAYELLSGRLPFESFDPIILRPCVLDEAPTTIDSRSEFVNNAIQRALAKAREDRFENCSLFVCALESNNLSTAPTDAKKVPQPKPVAQSPEVQCPKCGEALQWTQLRGHWTNKHAACPKRELVEQIAPLADRVTCPDCFRNFPARGLLNHWDDVHGKAKNKQRNAGSRRQNQSVPSQKRKQHKRPSPAEQPNNNQAESLSADIAGRIIQMVGYAFVGCCIGGPLSAVLFENSDGSRNGTGAAVVIGFFAIVGAFIGLVKNGQDKST